MHAHRLAEGRAEHATSERLAPREGVAVAGRFRKLQAESDQLERREMVGRAKYQEPLGQEKAIAVFLWPASTTHCRWR